MTTSGVTDFDPSFGEIIIYAYQLIGVRPAALLQEHMQSARTAANMLQSSWLNQGVNLWQVDLVEVPLVPGQSTYSVDPTTMLILDAYVTIDGTDRIILPISRTEYASYPNKEQQGFPTVFWFNRLISPTVTIWPVPAQGTANTLKYYRLKQSQNAEYSNGKTVDVPFAWLEALADGLAYRLSRIWAPQLSQMLELQSEKSYNIAANANIENANTYISPIMTGYWRV